MDTSLCGVDPQADQIGLNFYKEEGLSQELSNLGLIYLETYKVR